MYSLPPWLRGCVVDGRPDVPRLVREWSASREVREEERVHVHVCGPVELERAAAAACDSRAREGGMVHLFRMNFAL